LATSSGSLEDSSSSRFSPFAHRFRQGSVYWHKDGAFVIFPIVPGRYRVLADLPMTSGAVPPEPTLEQVQAIIDRRGPRGLTAFDPIWLAGLELTAARLRTIARATFSSLVTLRTFTVQPAAKA